MKRRNRRLAGFLFATAAWALPACAQQWRIAYLYDENKSSLEIADLQFPSATRGVAVGSLSPRKSSPGRGKPVAVVTSDGGSSWEIVPIKEHPRSLFFLNENVGWMVTEKGLWKTTEAGRNWIKLPKLPSRGLRAFFLDENTGWVACEDKTVLETKDGGKRWTRLTAAREQPGEPRHSAYSWIAFAGPSKGIITGWNAPPRRERLPDWTDPAAAASRRELPNLNLALQTNDGGKTWTSESASVFGRITRVRFGPGGDGLGLIEHSESFTFPSEVHRLAAKSELVLRMRDFYISDIWLGRDGAYYLAGIWANSKLRTVVPQKVRVLTSGDLKNWTEMTVDYRAVANSVIAAGAGDDLWLATNNGMILKLAR